MTDLVDPAVLGRLSGDVGPAASRRFAECYRTSLAARLARLRRATDSGDVAAAYEAALSLAAASAMAGALPLACRAEAVARALRTARGLPSAAALDSLDRLARGTDAALVELLSSRRRATPASVAGASGASAR